MKSFRFLFPVLLFFVLLPVSLLHAEDSIRGEFWVRRDLMDIVAPGENVREDGSYSERERLAMETLLEDARWVFSGMIYGFSFTWTPSASSRDVSEELGLEPLGLIPWGDPKMHTLAVVEENGFIYVQMEYRPDDSQRARLEGWSSQAYPVSTGAGEVRALSSSRRDALEQGVKEAVRAWLRAREYNRPREVSGRVAFDKFPVTGLRANNIKAAVVVRLDLDPLRHYAAD